MKSPSQKKSLRPGDRIKLIRLWLGLTQDYLSAEMGINRSSLVSWEGNDYGPSAKGGQALQEATGIPAGFYLFGEPFISHLLGQPSAPKSKRHLGKYLEDFFSLFERFCDENKLKGEISKRPEGGGLLLVTSNTKQLVALIDLSTVFDQHIMDHRIGLIQEPLQRPGQLFGCNALDFDGLHLWLKSQDCIFDPDRLTKNYHKQIERIGQSSLPVRLEKERILTEAKKILERNPNMSAKELLSELVIIL